MFHKMYALAFLKGLLFFECCKNVNYAVICFRLKYFFFSISGPDERCRLMRRTIVRYLNLGLVLTLRLTCLPVRKRFPTLDHLVEAGILEEKEKEVS